MDEPTPSYDHEEASVSLKVVLLLFAVVLVGALAYLVMNQRNASDETDVTASTMIVKKKSPTVTVTLTATVTSTENWKTYTNTDHNYSLKYPADWVVATGEAGITGDIALRSPLNKLGSGLPAEFYFQYYSTLKGLASYDQSSSATTLIDYLKRVKTLNDPAVVDYVAAKVGSVDAYAVLVGGVSESVSYYMEKNGHIFSLNFLTNGPLDSLTPTDKLIRDSFVFTK